MSAAESPAQQTTRERFLARLPARDRDERARYAEYLLRSASDADFAYASQKRAFGGTPADDFEAALFAELDAHALTARAS